MEPLGLGWTQAYRHGSLRSTAGLRPGGSLGIGAPRVCLVLRRKSAPRALGAFRAAVVFAQTTVAAWEQAARAAARAPSRPLPCCRSRQGPEADRQPAWPKVPDCLCLDLSTPLPEGNVSSLPLRVLSGDQLPARREGPRRLVGFVHVRRPRPPFTATCYWVLVGYLLSIVPSGYLPTISGMLLTMDGNTHGSSAQHGSLAQSLYSKHQTNPWRPYPQAASQTEATRRPKAPQGAMSNMPGSSQDLKVPSAGPDPQRTTIQGPIVSSYSSKLSTDDVTPKSP